MLKIRNVGIIGLGKMGILHAGIVNELPDTRVTSICEKDPLIPRLARKLLPKEISWYSNHAEMLSKGNLDALFITTPIESHAQIILDIVSANPEINLFVEKPLAESARSAQAVCKAVDQLRSTHMVGYQKRYSKIFQQAKKFIDEKSIGDLLFFRAYSFSSDVTREGKSWRFKTGTGGVLLDLAPHLIDVALWLFGDVESVTANRRSIYSSEVDDYAHAVLSYKSGLVGHIDACWSVRGFRLPEITLEIYGREGNMLLTDDMLKLEHDKGSQESRGRQTFHNQSFDTSVPFLLAQPEYTTEDVAFLDSIGTGKQPMPSFDEAAKVNQLIDRIVDKSAK